MLPKPKPRAMLKVVTRYEDIKGNVTDEDGRPIPIMVMSRPGEKVKDTDQDTLTITVVDTKGGQDSPVSNGNEAEPDDAHLEDAIAELERKLAGVKDD
jgi:hypothetical protein